MDVIVRANKGLFEEVKEKDMCEAIRELFHDEIQAARLDALQEGRAEGRAEARSELVIELLRDHVLSISDAAKRLEISEAELEAML